MGVYQNSASAYYGKTYDKLCKVPEEIKAANVYQLLNQHM